MMRLPIGSMPPFGSMNRMSCPTNVFGTILASTTRDHVFRGSDANHSRQKNGGTTFLSVETSAALH